MSQSESRDEGLRPNPYAVGAASEASFRQGDGGPLLVQRRGMINHVPVLAVLMMVQGALEVVMGLAFAGYTFFMPTLLQEMQQQAAKQGGQGGAMPAQMPMVLTAVGAACAVIVLAVGTATIYSGFNVFRYRGRTMAIGTLGTGLGLIFTCYCFPTAVALAIYGLIVLLDPSVKQAFGMRVQGMSSDDIQRAYAGLP